MYPNRYNTLIFNALQNIVFRAAKGALLYYNLPSFTLQFTTTCNNNDVCTHCCMYILHYFKRM